MAYGGDGGEEVRGTLRHGVREAQERKLESRRCCASHGICELYAIFCLILGVDLIFSAWRLWGLPCQLVNGFFLPRRVLLLKLKGGDES